MKKIEQEKQILKKNWQKNWREPQGIKLIQTNGRSYDIVKLVSWLQD